MDAGSSSALLVSGCAFIEYKMPLEMIWDFYFKRAVSVIESGMFAHDEHPTAFFPPGYSFILIPFIVVLGKTKWAVCTANLLLLIVSTLTSRWAMVRLDVPKSMANVPALLLFFYPTRLSSVYAATSDVPFASIYLMVFVIFLVAIIRDGRLGLIIGAGTLAGLASLVRSTGLLLFLPLLACTLVKSATSHRIRLMRTTALVIAFLVVIAPWMLRNANLFGTFSLSTNLGYNLLAGNNPVPGVYGGYYADEVLKESGNEKWTEIERDRFWTNRAIHFMMDNPMQVVVRGAMKVARTFSSDSYTLGALRTHTNVADLPFELLTVIYAVNNFLYFVLAGAILWYCGDTGAGFQWCIGFFS